MRVTNVVDLNQANVAREVRNTCDSVARFSVLETKLGTVNQQVTGWQLTVTVRTFIGGQPARVRNASTMGSQFLNISVVSTNYSFRALDALGASLSPAGKLWPQPTSPLRQKPGR